MNTNEASVCEFKNGDEEPCKNCPRRITALYMCGILQDIAEEQEVEEDELLSNNVFFEHIDLVGHKKVYAIKEVWDHCDEYGSSRCCSIGDELIIKEVVDKFGCVACVCHKRMLDTGKGFYVKLNEISPRPIPNSYLEEKKKEQDMYNSVFVDPFYR